MVSVINVQGFRANDAALAPSARNHSRVGSLAARRRQNALRHGHAANVFGAGFAPHENHFLALLGPFLGFGCREARLANRSSGNGVDAMRQDARFQRLLVHLGVDDRIEQPLDIFRLDAQHRIFLGDEFLVSHVHGDLERSGRSALSGARLQHIEGAVFDGELHVLHVGVVLFKSYSNFVELRRRPSA